jgi:hypothetical protein
MTSSLRTSILNLEGWKVGIKFVLVGIGGLLRLIVTFAITEIAQLVHIDPFYLSEFSEKFPT